MTVLYWIGIAFIMGVVEVMTLGLTTIWFSGGALIAALFCYFQTPLWMQVLAFLAVSIALMLITRPLATRYLNSKTVKTNAESLIGKICIVTQHIDNLHAKGQVKVGGQIWTARSYEDDILIEPETRVTILSISGVKLIVKPLEERKEI